jgi:CBS domain-containing protein
VTTGYSLLSAVELLARETGLHRVPVVDSERQLKSLLTQSQVVDFVVSNIHLLGDIRAKPVMEIESGKKEVLSVKLTVSAMEAFKFMATHQITGVAVVDNSGRLIDVLTLKDLKAISTDGQMFVVSACLLDFSSSSSSSSTFFPLFCVSFDLTICSSTCSCLHRFWRLYQTVEVFLMKVREETPNKPDHPLFCLPTQSFEHVVRTISNNRIHRVFIVDSQESMKPIGIISMKDVLKEIISS